MQCSCPLEFTQCVIQYSDHRVTSSWVYTMCDSVQWPQCHIQLSLHNVWCITVTSVSHPLEFTQCVIQYSDDNVTSTWVYTMCDSVQCPQCHIHLSLHNVWFSTVTTGSHPVEFTQCVIQYSSVGTNVKVDIFLGFVLISFYSHDFNFVLLQHTWRRSSQDYSSIGRVRPKDVFSLQVLVWSALRFKLCRSVIDHFTYYWIINSIYSKGVLNTSQLGASSSRLLLQSGTICGRLAEARERERVCDVSPSPGQRTRPCF